MAQKEEKKGLSFCIWIGLLSFAGLVLYVYVNREILSRVFLDMDFRAHLGRGLICGVVSGFAWKPLIWFLNALSHFLVYAVGFAIVAFFCAYMIFDFTFNDALALAGVL